MSKAKSPFPIEIIHADGYGANHEIQKLRDRCEAYKALVDAGAVEIARLTARVEQAAWQPIETAPKDGGEIWLISVQPQPSGHVYITINNGVWLAEEGGFVLGPMGAEMNSIGDGCATHWAPRASNPLSMERNK